MAGRPTVSDSQLKALHRSARLLHHNEDNADGDQSLAARDMRVDQGLFLRIDLKGADDQQDIVGYRAKKNSHIIDLAKIGYYSALDYWEPLYRHPNHTLLLEPEEYSRAPTPPNA